MIESGCTHTLTATAQPQLGSYDVLGSDGSECFDRFARLGPYGLPSDASAQRSVHDERLSSWDDVDFAELQRDCVSHRTFDADHEHQHQETVSGNQSETRTAVVLRAWDGFDWAADDLYNVRALFSELVLHSGGRYELFILMHIHNTDQALPSPGETMDDVKERYVPKSLAQLTELWDYTDCETAYPGVGQYE